MRQISKLCKKASQIEAVKCTASLLSLLISSEMDMILSHTRTGSP